jgi:hypothetical protein
MCLHLHSSLVELRAHTHSLSLYCKNTTTYTTMVHCVLDPSVLNAQTVANFTNLGLSIFAVLCGKNRGVFVQEHSTYSCLTLPPSFQDLVPSATITTSNDIGKFLFGMPLTVGRCWYCCSFVFITLSLRLAIQGRQHYRGRNGGAPRTAQYRRL